MALSGVAESEGNHRPIQCNSVNILAPASRLRPRRIERLAGLARTLDQRSTHGCRVCVLRVFLPLAKTPARVPERLFARASESR